MTKDELVKVMTTKDVEGNVPTDKDQTAIVAGVFAEKSEEGSTRIFSLEEFKDVARFDRKIDKAYLEGRFGAIANIDTNYED